MEEQRRPRVVRHVDVRPAVVVVVEHERREAEGRRGLEDARALRDVRERAVAVAVVERVLGAAQAGGAAHHDEALPGAALPGAGAVAGSILVGHVGGDEEVQAPVAVVVEKRAAGAVAVGTGQARGPRHVAEDAATLVPVERVLPVVRHEQVYAPVVVVVARAGALAPASARDPRRAGHVGERPVAGVAIEPAGRRILAPRRAETRAVHEEEVGPSVTVEVQDGHAAAGGLEDEVLGALAADDRAGGEPRARGEVDKPREGGGDRASGLDQDGAGGQRRGQEARSQSGRHFEKGLDEIMAAIKSLDNVSGRERWHAYFHEECPRCRGGVGGLPRRHHGPGPGGHRDHPGYRQGRVGRGSRRREGHAHSRSPVLHPFTRDPG